MSPTSKRRLGNFAAILAALIPAIGWVGDRSLHAVDSRYLHKAVFDSTVAANATRDSIWRLEARTELRAFAVTAEGLRIAIDSLNVRLRQMYCPPGKPACR